MDLKILKKAEASFLKKYPGGFEHPEMLAIGKKHKMEKLEAMAKESFAKAKFKDPNIIVDQVIKLAGQSTMISMFEKAKFRDMAKALHPNEKQSLSEAIEELLHGKAKLGFESWVELLQKHKLAKWPLATFIQSYYSPKKEVFVKPTTAKLIVENLKLDLIYKPTPTWDFYSKFRKVIKEAKAQVDKTLSPNNPAFCGFLMVSFS